MKKIFRWFVKRTFWIIVVPIAFVTFVVFQDTLFMGIRLMREALPQTMQFSPDDTEVLGLILEFIIIFMIVLNFVSNKDTTKIQLKSIEVEKEIRKAEREEDKKARDDFNKKWLEMMERSDKRAEEAQKRHEQLIEELIASRENYRKQGNYKYRGRKRG